VKIIETAFSIEYGGLRLKIKKFTARLNMTRIPAKSAHCQIWLMGSSTRTRIQKVQNAGTDNNDGKDGAKL